MPESLISWAANTLQNVATHLVKIIQPIRCIGKCIIHTQGAWEGQGWYFESVRGFQKSTTVNSVHFCVSKAVPRHQWPKACPVFREQLVTLILCSCLYVGRDSQRDSTVTTSIVFTQIYREDVSSLFCLYLIVASQTSVPWVEGRKQTFSPCSGLNCVPPSPSNSCVEARTLSSWR